MDITLPLFCGIVGLLVISYAIWVRREQVQNLWFMFGGTLLLIYSIDIGSIIFSLLQVIFVTSSLIELLRLRAQTRNMRETSSQSDHTP